MKIVVDRSKCSSIGICESIAGDLFQVGANGELSVPSGEVPEARRADVEQACEDCPTQALSIEA